MATALAKAQPAQRPETEMEFVPFQAGSPIKLSIAIVQNHICVRTKSGKICDSSQAIKFMMLCRARQLNPFEGDAYLVGYDTKDGPQFSLITSIQAFYKRAEVHPEFDGIESGVIVTDKDGNQVERIGDFCHKGDELLGAWATVYFKNRSHPRKEKINLGNYRKPYGRWNDDPAGMIVKCAEASCLRTSFPTLLGGLYLDGETQQTIDVPSSPAPSLPSAEGLSRLDGLNRRLEQQKTKPTEQRQETESSLETWEDVYRTIEGQLAACKSIEQVRELYLTWSAKDRDLDAEQLESLRQMCLAREAELQAPKQGADAAEDWPKMIEGCTTLAAAQEIDDALYGPAAIVTDESILDACRPLLKAKREQLQAAEQSKAKGKPAQKQAFDTNPNTH